jgi:hypothetical protein
MRSNEFAKGLFALSAGNVGTVFRIMEHVGTVALKENSSELSREHFAKAVDEFPELIEPYPVPDPLTASRLK